MLHLVIVCCCCELYFMDNLRSMRDPCDDWERNSRKIIIKMIWVRWNAILVPLELKQIIQIISKFKLKNKIKIESNYRDYHFKLWLLFCGCVSVFLFFLFPVRFASFWNHLWWFKLMFAILFHRFRSSIFWNCAFHLNQSLVSCV